MSQSENLQLEGKLCFKKTVFRNCQKSYLKTFSVRACNLSPPRQRNSPYCHSVSISLCRTTAGLGGKVSKYHFFFISSF